MKHIKINFAEVYRLFVPGVVLLSLTCAYIWRPFALGFYHDDWVTMMTTSQGNEYLWDTFWSGIKSGGRPVSHCLTYFFMVVFRSNSFLWQLSTTLVILSGAFFLWKLARQLFPASDMKFLAYWGPVIYALFPSSVYYGSWIGASGATLAAALLLCSFWLLVKSVDSDRFSVKPAIFFFLACGSYELAYFSFGPFFIIVWIIRGNRSFRILFAHFVSFIFVQLLSLGITAMALSKADPKAVLTSGVSGYNLIQRALDTFLKAWLQMRQVKGGFDNCLWIVALCTLVVLIAQGLDLKRSVPKLFGILLFSGLGLLLSAMILAFGGYAMDFKGALARTVVFWYLWSALGGMIILGLIGKKGRTWVFGTIVLTALSLALPETYREMRQIARTHSLQREFVAKLEDSRWLQFARKDTVFLFESRWNESETFTAPWDTSAAFWLSNYGIRKIYGNRIDFAFVVRRGLLLSEFKDGVFSQRYCNQTEMLWKTNAKRVLYIDFSKATIAPISRLNGIGCEAS